MSYIAKKIYKDYDADEIIIFTPYGANIYKKQSSNFVDYSNATTKYLSCFLAIADQSQQYGRIHYYKDAYEVRAQEFIQLALDFAPEALMFNFDQII